jgi:mannose-1-phosphate guanylyltransferase
LGAAVLVASDPQAVVGVFTADHLIEPVAEFQRIIDQGFQLVEKHPNTLVTFGVAPTHAATGYGYLELGEAVESDAAAKLVPTAARIVRQFREKPPLATAEEYMEKGPEHYLWNSGMFVWSAATLLDCIRRYEPDVFAGLSAVAEAWNSPQRQEVLNRVYPTLKKTSVDYGVMEPASRDAAVRVAAIPMPLTWLDVGSWPAFAATCPHDEQGNALAAKNIVCDTTGCLLASSDPQHLIATIGCQDLIVIHTPHATLVCPADRAEQIKQLQKEVENRWGAQYG